MSNCVHGYLPLEPAHLRYVEWRENLHSGQAIEIPGRSAIAAHLNALMSFAILFADEDRFPQPAPLQLQAYTAKLYFNANHHLARHEIFLLADRIAFYLNDYLYTSLHDCLLDLVIAGKRDGKQEQHIIEYFLRQTQLDEYLDFEAVKKAQYRARKYRDMPSIKGHSYWKEAV